MWKNDRCTCLIEGEVPAMVADGGICLDRVTAYGLGTVAYQESYRLQETLCHARACDAIGDVLLLLQHPPVITIGRGGGKGDILAPPSTLRQMGVSVLSTDRGGRATYHGPGQLVAYPIVRLPNRDLDDYAWRLEETAIRVLSSYGLEVGRVAGHPGVWVASANGSGPSNKIAALGLAVRGGISRHGLALNVAPDMAHFDLLISCGIADRGVTSLARELGWAPDLAQVAERFRQAFSQVFRCQVVEGDSDELLPMSTEGFQQPAWLWQRISPEDESAVARMEKLLDQFGLHTVCQEAHCPNLAQCFAGGTATFMILGDTCGRGCRFCAVKRGRPTAVDAGEPQRVAEVAAQLRLKHLVVTSVTRDDLPDGGARHFAETVKAVRRRSPGMVIEVLIPDFGGLQGALETVLAAEPHILNHNLETVRRLYPRVRPGADYGRSLGVLAWAKARALRTVTKSGLMLGLGETSAEVLRALYDLRQAQCDLLTLGQYLQPTDRQLPVERYVPPAEFAGYEAKAECLGFRGVAAGPLVRSSHRAEALWHKMTSG
jgi:lipoic acid synthetase